MTDEKSRQRRRRLYVAAEPLLMSYGYRKTTVEGICRAVGMSKRTFYELYRDKADFCVRLVLHHGMEMVERWRERVGRDMTSRRRLELYLEQYIDVCREHPVFRVVFEEAELMQAFSELCEMFDRSPLYLVLREILQEGIDRGEFSPLEPGATALMIYGLLDSMAYLMPQCYPQTGILEDDARARDVVTFILNGVQRCEAPGRQERA